MVKTKMTAQELCDVAKVLRKSYRGPDCTKEPYDVSELGLDAVANAAIARAIRDGDIVPVPGVEYFVLNRSHWYWGSSKDIKYLIENWGLAEVQTGSSQPLPQIPQSFNNWWNAGDLSKDNPFISDTPAFWAWEGWKKATAIACNASKPMMTESEIYDAVISFSANRDFLALEGSEGFEHGIRHAISVAPESSQLVKLKEKIEQLQCNLGDAVTHLNEIVGQFDGADFVEEIKEFLDELDKR